MRKKLTVLLILLMSVSLLAGCSAASKVKRLVRRLTKNQPTSISDLKPDENDYIQGDITVPDWITPAFLTVSEKNRPGLPLPEVKNIVIHYVANPGTSALANRNYFENLSDPAANPLGTAASAHFIVGLDGEILQCIPLSEAAYANYPRNFDTISIEVCHPEADGKFSDTTYQSLTRLASWLLSTYSLTEEDLIRHYDVSGKACPLYYAEHEDAWQQFKNDVRDYKIVP